MPSLTGFFKGWRLHRANTLADPPWRGFGSRCWRELTLRISLRQASNVADLKASVATPRSLPPGCAKSRLSRKLLRAETARSFPVGFAAFISDMRLLARHRQR